MCDTDNEKELITPEMKRAGADAMSDFDERFETRVDMVEEVFFAMIDAAPPQLLQRLLRSRLGDLSQPET
jgi:hypothetical protein